jgi:coproporphyrinogen III oxidase
MRVEIIERTGQKLYPAIEFENGTWYRGESRGMVRTIRAGRLMEHATVSLLG